MSRAGYFRTVCVLALCLWLSRYLFVENIPNVDLDAQLAAGERLWNHFKHTGSVGHYDPFWLGGYPAFYFYGFLPHLLTGVLTELISPLLRVDYAYCGRILLILCLICLPLLLEKVSREILPEEQRSESIWLPAICWVFAIWFSTLPYGAEGIGVAAAFHTGLFAQVVAWVLILAALAALLRYLERGSILTAAAHTIAFASLIITHPFSAAFYLAVVGVVILCAEKHRILSAISVLIALAFTSPFWGNFIRYREYFASEAAPGSFSLADMLFGLPLASGLPALFSRPMELNFGFLLAAILLPLCLVRTDRRSRSITYALLIAYAGAAFFQTYPSLGVQTHFYRFSALILLLLISLMSAAFIRVFVPLIKIHQVGAIIAASLFVLVALTSLLNPPPEYRYTSSERATHRYDPEEKLVRYLIETSPPKRVFQEYFNDYQLFDGFVSPHFISAKLNAANIETLSGLFIQSSKANILGAEAAALLGVDYYGINLNLPQNVELSLEKMRVLGVTHLILSHPHVIRALTDLGLPMQRFGSYGLFALSDPMPLVSSLKDEHSDSTDKIVLSWSDLFQTIEIDNLKIGESYTINYNYFPRWRCEGCEILPSSNYKISITANKPRVRLRFE